MPLACAFDQTESKGMTSRRLEDSSRDWLLVIRTGCVPCVIGLLALFLTGCETAGGSRGAGDFHTVVVDAGHGGYDQGARTRSGSPEKALALDTAARLARELRGMGFRVIETRKGDYFVPLENRSAVSNRISGAIFVSIHYNYSPRSWPRGIEIYSYSSRSRRMAANILKHCLRAYPTENRGVKSARFHVLRTNRRPAVLCELGFLTNPSDNRAVQNPAVRQRLAERIAAGILAEKQGRSP